MATKHTPGPWELFHRAHGGDKWTIAVFKSGTKHEVVSWTGFDSSHFQKQALANARLIAAAPELLAALKRAREYVVRIDGTMGFTAPEKRLTAPDIAVIDAAIAKAEGGTK